MVDGDGVRLEVGKVQELEHTSLDQPRLRINVVGWVGKMRVTTHLDFSIGGKPPIGLRELLPTPIIAGQSVVRIRAQPWVYSAADKLHSIVIRGCDNTRLKDYRDLLTLVRKGYGSNAGMREAVETTFAQRGTELPTATREGLTVIYSALRQSDWERYLDKNAIKNLPRSLAAVVAKIEAAFGESVWAEAAHGYRVRA
ncbi:nucleotidyl transferase AbiEii/AbiGii toxin family protein [Rhizobium sp. Leaf321]|uniref:nucleotidyl transferase AbiEii/AbiGii toxin family protein n=1 Tax=Rhizobium sp. Leaf321 TaxID=1736335 RepID=UPI0009E861FD